MIRSQRGIYDREYKFTVFTPTFNRAHTLHRVYESLCAQTYPSFEWLIIDDGSTDKTRDVINRWIGEASFPIRYFFQRNCGKHIAFNRAVALAKGELFVPADSDDGFVPQALERFMFHWTAIPEDRRKYFTGIVCRCMTSDGKMVGNTLPSQPLDTTSLEFSYIHKVRGETWGFHQTQVLRNYPFPEPTGLQIRFVPENIVWDAIARKYKIRCIDEKLRIYYSDAGNQLTSGDPAPNLDVRSFHAEIVKRDFDYFRYHPMSFIRRTIFFSYYSFLAADPLADQWRAMGHLGPRLLWVLALLPGRFLAWVHAGRTKGISVESVNEV